MFLLNDTVRLSTLCGLVSKSYQNCRSQQTERRRTVSEEQTSPDLLSSSNLTLKIPRPYKIITADVVVKCVKSCETEDTRLSDPPLPVVIAKRAWGHSQPWNKYIYCSSIFELTNNIGSESFLWVSLQGVTETSQRLNANFHYPQASPKLRLFSWWKAKTSLTCPFALLLVMELILAGQA